MEAFLVSISSVAVAEIGVLDAAPCGGAPCALTGRLVQGMTFILSTAGIGSSRRDQAMATAAECKYLWEIPKRHEIRQGQVLVHNSERPTWRLGMHEFGVAPGARSRHRALGCGWAAELGEHYRHRREEPAR